MWNIFLFAVLSLFVLGCSDSGSESLAIEKEKAYLSIARAPINSEVSITQKIVLDFSAELNVSSVTTDSVYILDESNSSIGLFLGVDGFKVLFTPYQYLKPSHIYTIVVTTDVKSSLGLSLSKNFTSSFTTAADTTDTTPITFVDIKPSAGSIAYPNSDISIEFSKNISPDSQYNGTELIKVTDSSGTSVAGDLSFFNSIVTFKPLKQLDVNTTYTVELVGTVTDMYANSYSGTSSWSFTTGSRSLPVNFGYKSLYSYNLNKTGSSIIRSVKSYDGNQTIAVASQNTIDLFDLLQNADLSPYLKPKSTYTVPSQINAMVFFNDKELVYSDTNNSNFINEQFIGVGTMNDGVYILKVDSTGVNEFVHSPSSTPIYGVSNGMKTDGEFFLIYRFYSVGPEYGISAFDVDENQTLVNIAHNAIAGTPLKVVSAIDYNYENAVYVADYSGRILKFDENCTALGSLDLNGSTRELAVTKDMYGSNNGILAVNSLGKGTQVSMDVNMSKNGFIDILSSATDINSFSTYDNTFGSYTSKVHVSDPSNGLIVYNSDYDLTIESIIKSKGHIVSSTFLGDYIATLDQEGVINIFNALFEPDTEGPYLQDAWDIELSPGVFDISVNFNEAVDPTTVNQNSFVLTDITDVNNTIVKSFTLQPSGSPELFYFLDANLTSNSWYEISVLSGVKDIYGNDVNTTKKLQFEYIGL